MAIDSNIVTLLDHGAASVPSAAAPVAEGSGLSTPEIAELKKWIEPVVMEEYIRRYASLPSRHIDHSGNEFAVQKLHDTLRRISDELTVTLQEFRHEGKTLHNVEARLPGDSRLSGIIIISAHLDSTGERTTGYRARVDAAPGADDDASGIAGVLAAAQAVTELAKLPGSPARREIRFVLFNAEELPREQLAGSRSYAREARRWNAPILGVYQMDMIGYNQPPLDTFELHAGFNDNWDVEEASVRLAERVIRVCGDVSPNLVPQIYRTRHPAGDPRAGGSDHAAFHDEGYPACLFSEDFHPGPEPGDPLKVPYPHYHLRTDEANHLDPKYAADIARAVAAAAWYQATR